VKHAGAVKDAAAGDLWERKVADFIAERLAGERVVPPKSRKNGRGVRFYGLTYGRHAHQAISLHGTRSRERAFEPLRLPVSREVIALALL